MAVVATNQVDVLNAVVARLIAQVSGLNSSTCFISDTPEPPAASQNNLFVTVAPTGGRFDEEAQIGAGAAELIEYVGFAVTIWSAMKLDRNEHANYLLTDATRGLLAVKKSVLKALVGHNLQVTGGDALVAYIRAINSSPPGYTQGGLGRITLTFSSEFLWDLS